MRPFRILLADLPRREEFYSYLHPTFGLLYLAGSLKRAFSPADVEVRYLQGHCTLREHVALAEAYKPDLYATSFKTPMARLASKTTHAVRAALPKLRIVAGGVHCTALPEDVLDHSPIDACFRGECEHAFVDLVSRWRAGHYQFEHAAGAVFRHENAYVQNAPQAFTMNLDQLAWPDWGLVENGSFPGMDYEQGPALGVVVSRGCPWKCTFCSEPVWKMNGSPTFRARSAADVAQEVDYLYHRGIREVRLWCEELNANIKWACEVLDAIARLRHRDLYLNSNIRADRVTPALADAMRNANMRVVCAGIESASQDTLNAILKESSREKIEASCGLLRSRGIKVLGYFLLYPAWERAGRLEFEDTRAAMRTINYGLELHRRGLLDYMSVGVATPRPSSPMWDLAHKYNLFHLPANRPFYYLGEGMALPGISRAEMRRTLVYARAVQTWIAVKNGRYHWRQFSDGLRRLVNGRRVA